MARAYSKMTMPGFIGLELWKTGSVCMRHHFHTWIGHHRVQTLTPLRIFGMCWRRLCAVVWLPDYQYSQDLDEKLMQHWTEIHLVTLQKIIETMPQRMRTIIKAKVVQQNISVWPFFWWWLFWAPGSVIYHYIRTSCWCIYTLVSLVCMRLVIFCSHGEQFTWRKMTMNWFYLSVCIKDWYK